MNLLNVNSIICTVIIYLIIKQLSVDIRNTVLYVRFITYNNPTKRKL